MSKPELTVEMMRDFLRFEDQAAKVPGLVKALAEAQATIQELQRELSEARVRIEDLENQVVELHLSL